ncbi:RNA-directed DNA polymerase from mobile element jockey [Trichonephila clavipes]|nr:RNA-directed DNA polymerase from mobile element jockey [Trichonephila clavipes]
MFDLRPPLTLTTVVQCTPARIDPLYRLTTSPFWKRWSRCELDAFYEYNNNHGRSYHPIRHINDTGSPRPPHGSINTIELDAILNHSNKTFLFGDFNAKHSSWNPGRSNTNGNILCNWAVGSALDIIAPDTPTPTPGTPGILDIGFAANLAHTDVLTINALSSDHNPVIFDFVTNNFLPPLLRTLKSTNWIKFQEIIYHKIPGNPQINNLDSAVQNFTDTIANFISASSSTRVINTPHLRLPENIRELTRAKNRFR